MQIPIVITIHHIDNLGLDSTYLGGWDTENPKESLKTIFGLEGKVINITSDVEGELTVEYEDEEDENFTSTFSVSTTEYHGDIKLIFNDGVTAAFGIAMQKDDYNTFMANLLPMLVKVGGT